MYRGRYSKYTVVYKHGRVPAVARRTADDIVTAVTEAAHELFTERSPAAVSLRQVAERAGVNLGLIHRYVGSKQDLVEAVLALHTRRARGRGP